jgi:hypothetical protein
MSETKKKFGLDDLRGAKQAAVKEQAREIESTGGGKKQEYIDLEEGTNKIRVFPAHPDTDPDNLYAQKRVVSWVPFKKDDGKESRRPVENAKIHGGQEKDIIEEYIKFATEAIKSDRKLSSKDKAKKLDALTDFKNGLAPKGGYQLYAKKEDKDGKVVRGILEVTYGIKRKMDTVATSELEENPEAIDPIADPIEGSFLKITYDSKKDNNNKYTVVLDRKTSTLTEEDVEWLNEQKPLTELLTNVYNKRHFEKAVTGLELYDEKNGIGAFDTDEFQDLISELKALVPDAPERGGDNEDSDTERVKLVDMDRNELKQFILDNEIDVQVTRKMEDEDILDAIEEALGFLPEYPEDAKKKQKKAEPKPAAKSSTKEAPFEADDDEEEEEDEKPVRSSKKAKPAIEEGEEEEDEDERPSRSRRSERRSSRRG